MLPNSNMLSGAIPRVTSNARLNNHIQSIPSTPVPTSRNPTNMVPEHIQELEIYQNLNEFENQLSRFASTVEKFSPNPSIVVQLIKTDRKISNSVNDLIEHQKYGEQIRSINDVVKSYDDDCTKILRTLIECRNDLKSLPTLDIDYDAKQNETNVQATDLLQYAMKLAKFTVAPPTFDAGSIGPNNFIWPAEDALRKGMLATASLCADKLIVIGEDETKNGTDESKESQLVNPEEQVRRSSYASFHENEDMSGTNGALADLDLFDPDDDDY